MEQRRPLDLTLGEEEAEARQRALAEALEIIPGPAPQDVRLVAAVDVAYALDHDEAYAAVVVLDRETLEIVDQAGWVGPPGAPYVPGLFALREASCLLPALEALSTRPDVLLVDGHGLAHPRRFGLACYLGWVFELPTIGCAKKNLTGAYTPPAHPAGSASPILDAGEIIGEAIRMQDGVNPVFTSPGYGYDVPTASALVLSVAGEYRIPEPLRQAHHLSITLRAEAVEAAVASAAEDA